MLSKIKFMISDIYYRFIDSKNWVPIIDSDKKFAYYNIKTHKVVRGVDHIFLRLYYRTMIKDEKFTKLYNLWKQKTEGFTKVVNVGEQTFFIIVSREENNKMFDVYLEITNNKTYQKETYIKEKEYELAAKFIEVEMLKILLDSREDIIRDIYFENNTTT